MKFHSNACFVLNNSSADFVINVMNLFGSDDLIIPPQPLEKSSVSSHSWFEQLVRRPEPLRYAATYSSSHHNTNFTAANEACLGKSKRPPTTLVHSDSCKTF